MYVVQPLSSVVILKTKCGLPLPYNLSTRKQISACTVILQCSTYLYIITNKSLGLVVMELKD